MENSAKDSRDIVTFLYDWGLLMAGKKGHASVKFMGSDPLKNSLRKSEGDRNGVRPPYEILKMTPVSVFPYKNVRMK